MATQRYKVYCDLISPEGVARRLDWLIDNVGPTSTYSPQGAVLLSNGRPLIKYSYSGVTRFITYRLNSSGSWTTGPVKDFGVYYQGFGICRDESDRVYLSDDSASPIVFYQIRNTSNSDTLVAAAVHNITPTDLSGIDALMKLPRNLLYAGRYSAGTYSAAHQARSVFDGSALAAGSYMTLVGRRVGHYRGFDFNGRDVGAIRTSTFTPPGNNYHLCLYRHNAAMGAGGRGWDFYSRTSGFTDTSRGPIGLSWDGRQWWAFHYCEYTDTSDE